LSKQFNHLCQEKQKHELSSSTSSFLSLFPATSDGESHIIRLSQHRLSQQPQPQNIKTSTDFIIKETMVAIQKVARQLAAASSRAWQP
jgi:hypothetical protein